MLLSNTSAALGWAFVPDALTSAAQVVAEGSHPGERFGWLAL